MASKFTQRKISSWHLIINFIFYALDNNLQFVICNPYTCCRPEIGVKCIFMNESFVWHRLSRMRKIFTWLSFTKLYRNQELLQIWRFEFWFHKLFDLRNFWLGVGEAQSTDIYVNTKYLNESNELWILALDLKKIPIKIGTPIARKRQKTSEVSVVLSQIIKEYLLRIAFFSHNF